MNVLLFGATGMIGQAVLRECLRDDRVKSVIVIARAPLRLTHPKLRELIHRDFTDFFALAGEFKAIDACFFCLGVTSAGKGEDEYRRITHDTTLAAARRQASVSQRFSAPIARAAPDVGSRCVATFYGSLM